MLLGKTERARELGLELMVEDGARLETLPIHIKAEDVVTILGNLIDNAFEATLTAIRTLSPVPPERRVIEVSISDFGNEIILEVDDQGCGLPKELEHWQLTEKGVSSKAVQNRGWGCFSQTACRSLSRTTGHAQQSARYSNDSVFTQG